MNVEQLGMMARQDEKFLARWFFGQDVDVSFGRNSDLFEDMHSH